MLYKTATVLLLTQDVSKVEDLNVGYITENLQALNYVVQKVSVILNEISVLAVEIAAGMKESDVVILIGGLSSQYFSNVKLVISKVFHQCFIYNERLAQLLCNKDETKESNFPEYAKLLGNSTDGQAYPVVYLQGLILTVADPELLKLSFVNTLGPFLSLFNSELKLTRVLRGKCTENARYRSTPKSTNVDVSYEMIGDGIKVTLTSPSMSCLHVCEESFKEAYGDNIVKCENGAKIVESVYENFLYPHVRKSIECIEECFSRYSPENVFISFNGGKDCTVLLHLALVVLKKKYPNFSKKLFCVYIEHDFAFRELTSFVEQCKWYYDLNIVKYTNRMQLSLTSVLKENPHLQACLMGTRRTDPYSEHLEPFQMTDSNWPQVMRVSPLLDWHYTEIWDYLLHLKVPYCSLYNIGFTSIGSKFNSSPNPALMTYNHLHDCKGYLPAHKLLNAALERNGRS